MLIEDLLEEVQAAHPNIPPDLFHPITIGKDAFVISLMPTGDRAEPIYFATVEAWKMLGIDLPKSNRNYWGASEVVNQLFLDKQFGQVQMQAAIGLGVAIGHMVAAAEEKFDFAPEMPEDDWD
jgi:hypothetical protein